MSRQSIGEQGVLSMQPKEMVDRNAMNLRWTFGFNLESMVLVDLTAEGHLAMFYAIGHTGVIFDYEMRQQRLLQGHTNTITCAATSDDKKWLATGDMGEKDAMIIVWNARTGVPVRSIFDPHIGGVVDLDMTPDAKYIASIGAGPKQTIAVWRWTSPEETPAAQHDVISRDLQTCVKFRRDDVREIMTNGSQRVIFWSWEDDKLKFYSPALSSKEFSSPVGKFTQSVFIPFSNQAVSATEDGDLLLWDQVLLPALDARPSDRCAVKLLKLHDGHAITFISVFDSFLVTAGADGFVRFYDLKFRLLAWYEDLDVGPIASLTFTSPRATPKDGGYLEGEVRIPNFIVATKAGKIALVNAAIFEQYSKEERKGEVLVQGFESPISAMCAYPSSSKLFVVTTSGMLRVLDFESQAWLQQKVLEKRTPTCICVNPNGQELVIGCTDGSVLIIGVSDLELIQRMSQIDCEITSVQFAPDGMHVAVADAHNCVGIFRRERNVLESGKEVPWLYVGRYRSHHGRIVGLQFILDKAAGIIRLVSLAQDRVIVEYDLSSSMAATGVVVRCAITIEETAVPTALLQLPPGCQQGEDPNKIFLVLDIIGLTGVHDNRPLEEQDSHCLQTLLGPTFGPPPHRLLTLPPDEQGKQYVVYATPHKVVGLIKLPLDGNPNCSMGLIAHAGEVAEMCASHDGKLVLTTGGSDCGIFLWEVDPSALEASAALGGSGIEPFEALIPGGKGGELYDEMLDYFYLAQLRAQGEDTTEERKVTGLAPVEAVPELMQAFGYYPSKFEIRDMVHEVRRKGKDSVTFSDLIKLFVNHKPVNDVSLEEIQQAFHHLGAEPVTGILKWEQLRMMLMRMGESLSESEIQTAIARLTGSSLSGREDFMASTFAENVESMC
ncbi:hypothetical protein GUITHDRAFT_114910 [Guillardia theta CCMP2712]|uniref:Cilia- and flagella-associated protein 251 n=1 Tax=Guillardia theta (strain CCMP2712) TaxID=905079 RepID=L1ISF4_GUITC|nr:hypothetical protein GUITHDRAFT_114910 [Guillardia theta CCMP2712]EKX39032.1 hypothetical protein GUITHDRAFT_114910 [Guillardia theta CCMP2712]|eukprot:XP_005826012.1 hypothetical protein GUITHDRAFT_114910 [Guillardia theta CCMP2712]